MKSVSAGKHRGPTPLVEHLTSLARHTCGDASWSSCCPTCEPQHYARLHAKHRKAVS